MQQTAAGQIGEDQNGKGDPLGNGGGQRSTGNTHVKTPGHDEDGVQDDVEDAAEAHADHGQGSAALASQTLVHNEAGGHKGRGKQYIGRIINGVFHTSGSRA